MVDIPDDSMPKEVLRIAKECSNKYSSDSDTATEKAFKQIRDLPNYGDFEQCLVRRAVRRLIHEYRHEISEDIKREFSGRPNRQKVDYTDPGIQEAHRSAYDLPMHGTTLGQLLGKDLLRLADEDEEKAVGMAVNAKILRLLAPMVDPDSLVKDCVDEQKVEEIIGQAQVRVGEIFGTNGQPKAGHKAKPKKQMEKVA